MKVLHLTTHLNTGGITSYITKLIQPLRELGVETYVLSSGGNATPLLRERGAQTCEFPVRTKSELHPKIYFALPGIIRFIRQEKIELLHAHTRVTQVISHWIHKFTNVPYVSTSHGFFRRRLGRRLMPALGDRVIAISEPVQERLRKCFGVDPSKIKLIPNGVDLAEIDETIAACEPGRLKVGYGFGAEDPVIGVVSRLIEDKGHEYLIRAIDLLKKKFPAIRLIVVGDGRYRRELKHLTQRLNLEGSVVFTRNIKDVTKALIAMDIFAFTPTYREGFGLGIVEAMACRRPVIASRIWAIDKLIEDRQTGILVPPKEVEPLADAIAEVLYNKEGIREKLAREGRKLVEEKFTIGRMARQIADVYRDVIEKV